MSEWAKTIQRNDLKRCPFCDTPAIEQMRLANSDTDMQFRITCGNPFCRVDVATPIHAGKHDAEDAWQDRPKTMAPPTRPDDPDNPIPAWAEDEP